MRKVISATLASLAAMTIGTTAMASDSPTKWVYDGLNKANTGGYGKKLTDWNATYDISTGAKKLAIEVAMGAELVHDDGFWLVLNGGGNPKGITTELAILYGDLANNKITAYRYNGANSSSSYLDHSAYLGTFNDAFTRTATAFSFNIDVTGINSLTFADWKGAQFGNQIGIWYHGTGMLSAAYTHGGQIQRFGGNFGWYDTGAEATTAYCRNGSLFAGGKCGQTGGSSSGGQVPEPASLALLGLGLAGLGLRRRRAQY